MSELLDLLLAGMDQPQADQPNSLAEGFPVGQESDLVRFSSNFGEHGTYGKIMGYMPWLDLGMKAGKEHVQQKGVGKSSKISLINNLLCCIKSVIRSCYLAYWRQFSGYDPRDTTSRKF
eukprot:1153361-Pelagomonas_calceolata.AAC.1